MITLMFCKHCDLNKLEEVELEDYKLFFEFYTKHYNKGIIFNVKEVSV